MNVIKLSTIFRSTIHGNCSSRWIHSGLTSMTSNEVSTALRPFIFSVHPDRFWRFPKEKTINERSLKKLNEFLEANRLRMSNGNHTVSFYMRNEDKTQLKLVEIRLNGNENVNTTVHRILSQCSLSTDYLDKLGKLPAARKQTKQPQNNTNQSGHEPIFGDYVYRRGNEFFYGDIFDELFADDCPRARARPTGTTRLVDWVSKNIATARERTKATQPTKMDLDRLRNELIEQIDLDDLRINCDWGATHIRGALKNLSTLAAQYPEDMRRLEKKVLIFGPQSGIGCKGEIILNIEDVRTGWLDMIRSVNVSSPYVSGLAQAESKLSELLNSITIVRPSSKVQLAKHYFKQIDRFTRTLCEHYAENINDATNQGGPPTSWPSSLSQYRLTVESDAGPLMLTNDGSFIVPASCPAKLALRHITDNLDAAIEIIETDRVSRKQSEKITRECIDTLGLEALEIDENITAEQMVDFGERLLAKSSQLGSILNGVHLRVSMYFTVQTDGQLCVPFNFH